MIVDSTVRDPASCFVVGTRTSFGESHDLSCAESAHGARRRLGPNRRGWGYPVSAAEDRAREYFDRCGRWPD